MKFPCKKCGTENTIPDSEVAKRFAAIGGKAGGGYRPTVDYAKLGKKSGEAKRRRKKAK